MPDISKNFKSTLANEFSKLDRFSDKEGFDVYNGFKNAIPENDDKLKKDSIKTKTLDDIVKKNSQKGKSVSLIEKKVKSELVKGVKVEMEHTDDKEVAKKIAMAHLYEDLEYYEKLKKIESKEATGSGSSGGYEGPLFGSNKKNLDEVMKVDEYEKTEEVLKMIKNEDKDIHGQILMKIIDAYAQSFDSVYDLISKSDKISDETKNKVKKIAQELKDKQESSKNKKKGKKTETKEATGSGSSGSYETPAAWAKSTRKKDWRGRSKTQIPGGKFVTIKKRCKTFPYCNQGDIKALKIYENERVKNIINEISKKYNVPINVIKSVIQDEIENNRNKSIN